MDGICGSRNDRGFAPVALPDSPAIFGILMRLHFSTETQETTTQSNKVLERLVIFLISARQASALPEERCQNREKRYGVLRSQSVAQSPGWRQSGAA